MPSLDLSSKILSRTGVTNITENNTKNPDDNETTLTLPNADSNVIDFSNFSYNQEQPTYNQDSSNDCVLECSVLQPVATNLFPCILPKDFDTKKESLGIPFSQSKTTYNYNDILLKNIEEKRYLGDNDFLLSYAYSLETTIGLTLPLETFGLSENVFDSSMSHEVVEIDKIKYFSCKEKTLNKERLDNLLKNISESISTTNSFSMPMVSSQIFLKDKLLFYIPTLVVNTYEFNIIVDMCSKIGNILCLLNKYEDQTYLNILKQD